MTSIKDRLNDDVLRYIINFFDFYELFESIGLVDVKFHKLALEVESNRLYQKIKGIDHNNENIYIVTTQRKFRLPIENRLNLKGPYNKLANAMHYITDNGLILIVQDGDYSIESSNYMADEITKNIQIIGLPSKTFGIEIEMTKIQIIYRNVTFKNIIFYLPYSDPSYFVIHPYAHLKLYDCIFTDLTAPIGKFIDVHMAGYLTIYQCTFQGPQTAIEIDNKACDIIIHSSRFQNMPLVEGNPDYIKYGCIELSDMPREMRKCIMNTWKDDIKKLTSLKKPLMMHCTGNVFIDLEVDKRPFIESAYDKQTNDSQCVLYDNYSVGFSANMVHFIHPSDNPNFHFDTFYAGPYQPIY